MNKKLKATLALTLIIQLLIPSFLLWHHNFVLNSARALEEEYTLRLYFFNFSDGVSNPSPEQENVIQFSAAPLSYISSRKYTVTVNSKNIVTGAPRLTDENKTDTWFYGRAYSKNSRITPDKYSVTEGTDIDSIERELSIEAVKSSDDESREFPYLTAKIYKGVFLPTAIYFKGEKIIDIFL